MGIDGSGLAPVPVDNRVGRPFAGDEGVFDDVILDAELVVVAVDAIGMEASMDQSAWPVTRQCVLLARLLDVLDR